MFRYLVGSINSKNSIFRCQLENIILEKKIKPKVLKFALYANGKDTQMYILLNIVPKELIVFDFKLEDIIKFDSALYAKRIANFAFYSFLRIFVKLNKIVASEL